MLLLCNAVLGLLCLSGIVLTRAIFMLPQEHFARVRAPSWIDEPLFIQPDSLWAGHI